MDVCCINRPFDDLSQDRIQFESDSVLAILSRCESGEWTLVSSEVIDLELARLKNHERLNKIRTLCSISKERLVLNEVATERAKELQRYGIKVTDSLHLAVAEAYEIDVFLTTDDDFFPCYETDNDKNDCGESCCLAYGGMAI
jgi:predicted nucleic acid-binding protein